MTTPLAETIQRIVRQQLAGLRRSAIGAVQDQQSDTGDYSCTVALRDSQVVLKDVPLATGTLGYVAAPAVGDSVLVEFVGSDFDEPVIIGRLYSEDRPPPPASAGSVVLRLPSGADDANASRLSLSGVDREVTLALGESLRIELRDGNPAVEVSVANGRTVLSIARSVPRRAGTHANAASVRGDAHRRPVE